MPVRTPLLGRELELFILRNVYQQQTEATNNFNVLKTVDDHLDKLRCYLIDELIQQIEQDYQFTLALYFDLGIQYQGPLVTIWKPINDMIEQIESSNYIKS